MLKPDSWQQSRSHKEHGYVPGIPKPILTDEAAITAEISEISRFLESKYKTLQHLNNIAAKINAGMLLTDIMGMVYEEFHAFIPYTQLSLSLVEYNEAGERTLRVMWNRNANAESQIPTGHQSTLAGSNLEGVLDAGKPRIINDLPAYFQQNPHSKTTRLILEEGGRSSLTCPLMVNQHLIGVIFFSSNQRYIYSQAHIDRFDQISEQLAHIIEKGALITELAHRQAEIEEKNAELKRLNDLKNEFLGMAAHDLRNPIGHIEAVTRMMLDTHWDFSVEEKEEFLTGIVRQTGHVMSMLEDMLNITQIDTGNLMIRQMEVNIFDILHEMTARHNHSAHLKDSRVELTLAGVSKAVVDPVRLRQILDNLISNAIKYSPPGSDIEVRARQEQHCWHFSVQDQGPGIRPYEAHKVFTDFAKLSATPTAGEPSVGLGLAVTKRMVQAQGGEIGFYNRKDGNNGAVFWFTIPHQTSDETPQN